MASGNISVSKSSISSCPESTRINLMACEIEHDGEAQVASYFDTSVREEEANSGVQNSVKGMYGLFMKRASFVVRCVGEEWVGSGCWNPSIDGRGENSFYPVDKSPFIFTGCSAQKGCLLQDTGI